MRAVPLGDVVEYIEDDDATKGLSQWLREHQVSSIDFFCAYEYLLDNSDTVLDEHIKHVVDKLRELRAQHVSYTKLLEFYEALQNKENGQRKYREFIERLPIIQLEKQALIDMLEDGKSGKVAVHRDGYELGSFTFKVIHQNDEAKNNIAVHFMVVLGQILVRIPDHSGLSITFEELL